MRYARGPKCKSSAVLSRNEKVVPVVILNWKYPNRVLALCTEKWWAPIRYALGYQRGNWFIGFMRFHDKTTIEIEKEGS